eukprot:7522376-Pyramimonas_sp.AAC.1
MEYERECGSCCFALKTAFPSLRVQWVQHVLEKTGVPDWYSHAIMTVYANVTTPANFRGATGCSFQAGRGVKQGCPMSGTLFAVRFGSVL